MSTSTDTKGTEFVSEKAEQAIERAAKAKWTETLDAWQIRSNIDDVVANWTAKVPTVHDYDGKCLKQTEGLVDRKSSHWLEQAFAANGELGRQGKPRTYGFCTRCVIEKTEAAKAQAKADRAATKAIALAEGMGVNPAARPVIEDMTEKVSLAKAAGEEMAAELTTARARIDAENADTTNWNSMPEDEYFENDKNFDGSGLAANPEPVEPWAIKDDEGVSEDDVVAELVAKPKARAPRKPRASRAKTDTK